MLTTRILSSLVILPAVLAAVWWGGYPFLLLLALFGGAMVWELLRLSGVSARLATTLVPVLGALTPFAPSVLGYGYTWLWVAGVVVVFVLVAVRGPNAAKARGGFFAAIILILLSISIMVWLRGEDENGRVTVFWLIATIAGTDIGAYFAGRLIGGPKLATSISPNKTWAGLVGGIVLAGVVGLLFAISAKNPALVPITLTSAVLAPVAQGGDLFESWLKRRLGVKDASALIPGHGGVLDRVDGYLTAVPLVALIALMHEGSLLTWP